MINQFKLHSSIVFIVFCAGYAVIIFNLYLIQIRDSTFFTQIGSQQYHVTVTQTPPRAPIFDRSGKHYLAMNNDCLSAFALPTKITHPERLKSFLKRHFPQALEQLHKKKNKYFMYVKRKLSKEQLDLITKANLADIYLLHESSRFYPIESAASIVGLTDIDNKGVLGIELMCDKTLAGIPTTLSLEKDARSGYFYFKKETKKMGSLGNPVCLTIDSDLQFLVHEEIQKTHDQFAAQESAAIIMDPKNGEILAMASFPLFNPNDTQQLIIEQTKNKLITDAHELGSVMKVFTALAALQEGVVTPDELIDCKNSKTAFIDGRKINTVEARGIIPFCDVIAYSNNIGIATVAKRLGPSLYDYYLKLGFGNKTNIELPGENKGFVNPPENWSKQSIISLSYGYEISATLLQLACAFSLIANNGYAVKPTLILNTSPTNTAKEKLFSDTAIKIIKDILERTTQNGTAQRAAIQGYTIMSKTGTANLLTDGIYDPNKNIYTCAGIVQKGEYQRVVVTFVKQAQRKNLYAATVAAPLFEKVVQKMLIHERIV
ncbi:MAG: penicillin-binding protein 2 [bacterium]|nr:penicillin-binding protein 2 [bacterium]